MMPYRQQANKEEILITANIITYLHSTQIATIWGLRLTNSVIAILPALSFLDFFCRGTKSRQFWINDWYYIMMNSGATMKAEMQMIDGTSRGGCH